MQEVPAERGDVVVEVGNATMEAVTNEAAMADAADAAGVSASETRHAPPPPPPTLRARSSLVRALSAVGLWPEAINPPSSPEATPLRPTRGHVMEANPNACVGARQETTRARKWEVKDPALGVRLTRR